MPKTFCDNVSVTQRGAAEQLLETPHETSLPNWDDNGQIFSKNILIYYMIQLMEVDQTDPGKCPNINIKPTVRKTFRDPSTGWLIYMRKEKELLAICRQVTKFRYLVKCLSSPWRPFSSIWLNGGFNEEESRNVQEMVMMSQTVTSPVCWKYPC